MHDRIGVPLDLDGFEVAGSEVCDGILEVQVRSTRRPHCHHCGSVSVIGHGRNERRIRDRACVHPTVLRWSQRRFFCKDCGRTSRERHPELAGRRAVTNRFRRCLFERAVAETFSHVAATEAVTLHRVMDAFETLAIEELPSEPVFAPEVLSIDESAFRRRFRFHTVISDPVRRRTLELLEGRHKADVAGWLGALPPQVRGGIKTVTMDLFWPYRRAVEKALPGVRIVADKFHVLAAVTAAAQRVRRRFGRGHGAQWVGTEGGTDRQHHPRNDPEVFRLRWVFAKRFTRLSQGQKDWLERVFVQTGPELRAAWWIKEAFAAIYDAPDRAEAERRLDVWIGNLDAARLPEFTNTWRTLKHWREQILAYFDHRVTNAFAEGITNKIKVLKRSAYGFRSPERYRAKVLLATGHWRSHGGSTHRVSW